MLKHWATLSMWFTTYNMKEISITIEQEVPFYDVDSYRIVWHGNYVKYFETARCKLLAVINYTYNDMEESGYFFPIIDVNIKYIRPLVFGQKFTIKATIKEWEHKLTIHYLITDSLTKEKLTKGHTSQVAIAMPDKITQYQSPKILIDKITQAMNNSCDS
jgi:acyl-CoA thioester hydrolase